jgi:hypothetical protein
MGLIVNPTGRSPANLGGIIAQESISFPYADGQVLDDLPIGSAITLSLVPNTGAASCTLDGVVSQSAAERWLIIKNLSATATVNIAANAAGSAAANRFAQAVTLPPLSGAYFLWTPTNAWVLIGNAPPVLTPTGTLAYFGAPVNIDISGATATSLINQNIPGGTLGTNKQAIFRAFGRYKNTAGGGSNVQIVFAFGAGTQINVNSTAVGNSANVRSWRLEARVQNLGVTNAQALTLDWLNSNALNLTVAGFGGTGPAFNNVWHDVIVGGNDAVFQGAGFANDTTVAQPIQVTLQVGAAFTGPTDFFVQTYASLLIQ